MDNKRNTKNKPQASRHSSLEKRIKAGTISYQSAVKESLRKGSPLKRRVYASLEAYDCFDWRSPSHRQRFEQIEESLSFYSTQNIKGYYAALYLLSADADLFKQTLPCFSAKKIFFDRAHLHNISTENYTLFKVAKSLYTDTAEVGVDELTDPILTSKEAFHLITNAMLLYRYGLSVLSLTKKGDNHGYLQS